MAGDCYCILLRTAARKTSAIYDEALASLGINIAQFSMLRRIARAAPVSLTELGRLTELDRSTVGRNAKVLERMNLVRTVPARDQREATLVLSDHGQRILAEGAPLWDQAQEKIESMLGADAAKQLRTLIQAL
ncbi:MarR family winged helix-turn-helix transcriptional regulator [Phreatobacter stygius]|uniref:MarR family transcriptional regulator n=1 Tax=Phreatobacter stygius TaxID=1940610 RepID=A0A4D7B616_9HYPH|nr:MarR family transcriptional regulator [Phreatobacter stygius]QCI69389.1 MarR family transcriptional regulator [Phreatobacter stygius]